MVPSPYRNPWKVFPSFSPKMQFSRILPIMLNRALPSQFPPSTIPSRSSPRCWVIVTLPSAPKMVPCAFPTHGPRRSKPCPKAGTFARRLHRPTTAAKMNNDDLFIMKDFSTSGCKMTPKSQTRATIQVVVACPSTAPLPPRPLIASSREQPCYPIVRFRRLRLLVPRNLMHHHSL